MFNYSINVNISNIVIVISYSLKTLIKQRLG